MAVLWGRKRGKILVRGERNLKIGVHPWLGGSPLIYMENWEIGGGEQGTDPGLTFSPASAVVETPTNP